MSLEHVVVGGPHVQAHNDVRDLLNAIQAVSDSTFLTALLEQINGANFTSPSDVTSMISDALVSGDYTNEATVDSKISTAISEIPAQTPPSIVPIVTKTASYTPVLADAGKCIQFNLSAAGNFTIPLNSAVPFPIETLFWVRWYGAVAPVVNWTSGVVVHSPTTTYTPRVQWSTITIHKIGIDEYVMGGDLA